MSYESDFAIGYQAGFDAEQPNSVAAFDRTAYYAGYTKGSEDKLSVRVNAPRWKHDCTHCTFLGRYDVRDHGRDEKCDLYIHVSSTHRFHSLIARWSSDGPDYLCGTVGSQTTSLCILEAERRALKRGLI